MTRTEVRQSFLDFFREKEHTIVPSSSLLPDAPNLLFTNAGMNQFVPIFLGQQKPMWVPPRVADTQKCIRAGGKHNDLEDVGLDTYHHTFFEMLGNWSFGDYFKKEAIEWAWELLVERWKFPAQRLYATVYQPGPDEPSEFDQEAYDHWSRLFREADLDPKIHVLDGGKADNFWMMGDTGPCGPCSEVHVDLTPDGDTRGALVNKNDPRCIEIWNLVFIQVNANPDGSFTPLPQRHVDTGMGFERVTAIIQGTKNLTDFSGTISNYDTDVFRPIFDEIEKLSGKKYASTLPAQCAIGDPQSAIDVAFRVIADHIRSLSFAIADGIIPSNEGRGYVLRRILRRAVRYGRSLDFHEPFFFKLVDVVAKTMGDVFPEIRARQKIVEQAIRREEEAFNKTLDAGLAFFEITDRIRRVLRKQARVILDQGDARELEQRLDRDDALERIYQSARLASDTLKRTLSVDEQSLVELARKQHEESEGLVKYGYPIGTVKGLAHEQIARLVAAARRVVETEMTVSGIQAFVLYDTYGFPLDLTEVMARERGLNVDVAGFEDLMKEQRERARKAQKKDSIEIANIQPLWGPTQFVGYSHLSSDGGHFILDNDLLYVEASPFYAEMGGQVGDTRWVESTTGARTRVINTVRTSGCPRFEVG